MFMDLVDAFLCVSSVDCALRMADGGTATSLDIVAGYHFDSPLLDVVLFEGRGVRRVETMNRPDMSPADVDALNSKLVDLELLPADCVQLDARARLGAQLTVAEHWRRVRQEKVESWNDMYESEASTVDDHSDLD
jgi:hypothetical protein